MYRLVSVCYNGFDGAFENVSNSDFTYFTALIDNNECIGHEAEVKGYVKALQQQWEGLLEKIHEKTHKLREANQQQLFNEATKDLDFWLSGVRSKKLYSDTCHVTLMCRWRRSFRLKTLGEICQECRTSSKSIS